MLITNRLFFFIFSFLFTAFIFLSLPEKSFSGVAQPIGNCCQVEPDQCFNIGEEVACRLDDFRPNSLCNEETGLCEATPAPIPTLNEWGLITVIITLGVVGTLGILVYRRRKASA